MDKKLYIRKELVKEARKDIIYGQDIQGLSDRETAGRQNFIQTEMYRYLTGTKDLQIAAFDHFSIFNYNIYLLTPFTKFLPTDSNLFLFAGCKENYCCSGITSTSQKVDVS